MKATFILSGQSGVLSSFSWLDGPLLWPFSALRTMWSTTASLWARAIVRGSLIYAFPLKTPGRIRSGLVLLTPRAPRTRSAWGDFVSPTWNKVLAHTRGNRRKKREAPSSVGAARETHSQISPCCISSPLFQTFLSFYFCSSLAWRMELAPGPVGWDEGGRLEGAGGGV